MDLGMAESFDLEKAISDYIKNLRDSGEADQADTWTNPDGTQGSVTKEQKIKNSLNTVKKLSPDMAPEKMFSLIKFMAKKGKKGKETKNSDGTTTVSWD